MSDNNILNGFKLKYLGIFIFCLLLLFSGIGCSSSETVTEPSDEEAVEEYINIEIVTFFSGTSVYAVGIAMAELINEQSDFLRATAVEGKSGLANIRMLIDEEDKRSNTIIWGNPVDLWESANGVSPWEEANDDVKPFVSNAMIAQHLFTLDPNIKSLKDLSGKTVAIGPGHIATRVTFIQALIEASGAENVRYENLGLFEQMQALADGVIDATVANVYLYSVDPFEYAWGAESEEVLATREVYAIPIDEEMVNKGIANMPAEGFPLFKFNIEPNLLLDTQDYPITMQGGPSCFSAHVDMDPRIIKEFMRIYYANMDKFVDYNPFAVYINDYTAGLLGLDDQYIHPAGLEFMEESGYKYYKELE